MEESNVVLNIIKYSDTKKMFIDSIYYEDKLLAKFNTDTGKIDLSVLNPFVNKLITLKTKYLPSNELKINKKILTNMTNDKNIGLIASFSDTIEEI